MIAFQNNTPLYITMIIMNKLFTPNKAYVKIIGFVESVFTLSASVVVMNV